MLAGVALSATPLGKPVFTRVRLCTSAHVGLDGCTTNERGSTRRTNGFACSYGVSASRAGTALGFWRYDGVSPRPERINYPAGASSGGAVVDETGDSLPLPGGMYTCVLRAGSTQETASIRSSGPAGPIVDLAACSGARAIRVGQPMYFPVCQENDSKTAIGGAGAGSVVCNAVYPSDVGHEALIELLRDGTVVGHVRFSVDDPLVQGYLERPSDVNSTPLQPGNYGCRFTVSGAPPVTVSFSLVPGKPSPTEAAIQVLRELSELRVRNFDVVCVPNYLLQLIADPDPGDVVLGEARVSGKFMLLDNELVCAPLAAYAATLSSSQVSSSVLLALSVVAHEYGHTLGLRRENVVECFAARVVWKWVRRSDLAPSAVANARKFILDNSRRLPAYKLAPTCTLPD